MAVVGTVVCAIETAGVAGVVDRLRGCEVIVTGGEMVGTGV
jgi:hypothetical protein